MAMQRLQFCQENNYFYLNIYNVILYYNLLSQQIILHIPQLN